MTTPPEASAAPYRIVDHRNQGWLHRGGGRYDAYDPHTRTALPERPLADIEQDFGPCRPVLPLLEADRAELEAAFDAAGRKTITTLASAIEQVFHEARRRHLAAHGTGDRDDDYGYAVRTLTAGRPGSWESEVLIHVGFFGNELNLHPYNRKLAVDEMRATGPTRRRVDVPARDRIADVLRRWTNSPDRYTEVAETLASVVSQYADERYGPDGWCRIADQWLQPGGMAVENFGNCYRLFYSLSAHLDANKIP